MIADLIGELGVHMRDLHPGRGRQGGAHEEVIERLGIALEDIGIARGRIQRIEQIGDDRRAVVGAGQRFQRRQESELVEVADQPDARFGHRGERVVHERVDHRGLGHALVLGAVDVRL